MSGRIIHSSKGDRKELVANGRPRWLIREGRLIHVLFPEQVRVGDLASAGTEAKDGIMPLVAVTKIEAIEAIGATP